VLDALDDRCLDPTAFFFFFFVAVQRFELRA
jgi:hypothetical protein